ncbi:MAG: TFIIB-type zinc ribbon-containing protein [Planctomycetota bacterium]|jgi:DNA-directed RNA polymerase subunit RPC12/RpoP
MTISFHCEHCGKKIEAPDSTGGKWGKCPACRNKVYVPGLDSDEELKLAPIDESALEEQKRLMAETHQVEQEILNEKDIPEDSAEAEIAPLASDASEQELTKEIIVYLRRMADGDLDQADRLSNAIVPYGNRALEILDKIALSEIPEPELADIPPQVLSGLIRTLRNKIS